MSAGTSGARRTDPAQVADELRGSRRYVHLCDRTLWRMACWAADRSPTARDAVKKAKRKLHQVYGAYVSGWKPDLGDPWAGQDRQQIPGGASDVTVKDRCLRAMALHASTRERAPFLDRFYREVFEITGLPRTALDLGCGLHPLAIPWMALPPGSRYDAVDMDGRVVAAVRGFFACAGQAGSVSCGDLLDADAAAGRWAERPAPDEQAGDAPSASAGREVRYDLAFLLKTVPCLEHQEKGASERLLRAIRARAIVISFSRTSLGAGRRQAVRQYDALAERLIGNLGLAATRLMIGNELVFALAGDASVRASPQRPDRRPPRSDPRTDQGWPTGGFASLDQGRPAQ